MGGGSRARGAGPRRLRGQGLSAARIAKGRSAWGSRFDARTISAYAPARKAPQRATRSAKSSTSASRGIPRPSSPNARRLQRLGSRGPPCGRRLPRRGRGRGSPPVVGAKWRCRPARGAEGPDMAALAHSELTSYSSSLKRYENVVLTCAAGARATRDALPRRASSSLLRERRDPGGRRARLSLRRSTRLGSSLTQTRDPSPRVTLKDARHPRSVPRGSR